MAHEVHLVHSRASDVEQKRKWDTLEMLPQAFHDCSGGTVKASLHTINSVLDPNAPPFQSKFVVLVCDPVFMEFLGQRRDHFAEFVNHISSEKIRLVILRVHGVSTETILEIAPPLRSFIGQQLCVDFYVDREEDVVKITEAVFEKLFEPSDQSKDTSTSNGVWNTQGCLAANQIPTQPPCVNQNAPDAGSLSGCPLNDNASSLTADDAPDMEATEPESLRERMQKEREWERTVELLGCAASSKSQSYPVNQDTREGHISLSTRGQLQHTLQNQDSASPHMSVEESLRASAGSCTLPSPVRNPRNSTQATAMVPPRRNTPASGSLSQSNQTYSRLLHAQVAPLEQTMPKTLTEGKLNRYLEQSRTDQQQQEQRVPPPNSHTRLEIGFSTGPPADMESSPSNNRQNEKVKDLREDLLDELSIYLDPPRCGMKNWRCFASIMGIKCAKIDYMESRGDPTRAMLKLNQFRNCTVGEFKALCRKYERFDVLEDVFEVFGY
ncbi:uncharacterized protein LOC135485390 isoform X2 [Lineus longissimus]|uniref:uncharacterized protein LOC135485390 isoform X2 n=1 Tax=Lineus longissimus TaxID=88925 RepID=UPI00315DD393